MGLRFSVLCICRTCGVVGLCVCGFVCSCLLEFARRVFLCSCVIVCHCMFVSLRVCLCLCVDVLNLGLCVSVL